MHCQLRQSINVHAQHFTALRQFNALHTTSMHCKTAMTYTKYKAQRCNARHKINTNQSQHFKTIMLSTSNHNDAIISSGRAIVAIGGYRLDFISSCPNRYAFGNEKEFHCLILWKQTEHDPRSLLLNIEMLSLRR